MNEVEPPHRVTDETLPVPVLRRIARPVVGRALDLARADTIARTQVQKEKQVELMNCDATQRARHAPAYAQCHRQLSRPASNGAQRWRSIVPRAWDPW